MIIAVSYENGEVFQHFGHSEQFKLYEVAGDQIVSSRVMDTGDSGHEALAGVLGQQHTDILICGGIGDGAKQALARTGIRVFGGVTGGADASVEALLNGTLDYDPAVCCTHHGEGHSCGGGCGGCHGCH